LGFTLARFLGVDFGDFRVDALAGFCDALLLSRFMR
jgi:hypothetical protein